MRTRTFHGPCGWLYVSIFIHALAFLSLMVLQVVINGTTGFIFAVICLYAIADVDAILESPAGAITEIYLQVSTRTFAFRICLLNGNQATRNHNVTSAMVAINPIVFGLTAIGVSLQYCMLYLDS